MPQPDGGGLTLPAEFMRTVSGSYGNRGQEWMASLPDLLAECERRWALTVQPAFPNLSYNYVAPAVLNNGMQAVLKLGVPNPELTCEAEALRLYAGRGAARLFEADAERGILLLERVRPGTPLVHEPDDERATSIAAAAMRQLWRPAPADHKFPTAAQWAAGLGRLRAHFHGTTGPLPALLVERAEAIFAELLASTRETVLLHGDLHHANILSGTRAPWLAIDPKGLVGDPAYEPSAWLRNPIPDLLTWPDPRRSIERRVRQLSAELGLDRERIRRWAFAQAVLSAWWTIEDNGTDWEYDITCAEHLAALPT